MPNEEHYRAKERLGEIAKCFLVAFDFNEDVVLEIDVEEGNKKPYYLREKGPKPSGVYKRVGTSIRKCNEDEILRMIMDSRFYDYEGDVSESQDLTFRFLGKFCDEHDIAFGDKQTSAIRPHQAFNSVLGE